MIGWLMVTGLKILVTQADHNEAIYIYMYLVIYMESNELYRKHSDILNTTWSVLVLSMLVLHRSFFFF